MNNEELLAKFKEIYNTTLEEDNGIYKEIEELSKENNELFSNEKIKKLEEIEYILKNGKTFKDKLKRFFSILTQNSLSIIFIYIFEIVVLITAYDLTFSLGIDSIFIKLIIYALDALMTAATLVMPIHASVHIHKIDKKYKLEEISLELKNTKERKEFINKELELKKSLHEIKQQKLSELEGAIKSIEEFLNVQSPVDNFDLTNEQEVNLKTKEDGKKLILEKSNN